MTTAVPSLGRLRWQCRRGMKELDFLLERWLDLHYAAADEQRRKAFQRLLEAQDPELVAWLFERERPADAALAALVDELLERPG
jgi:antitoxin CptB